MSARDRFDAAEDDARKRATESASAAERQSASTSDDESERRERARKGPPRPAVGREFARRARDAEVEPELFSYVYVDPPHTANRLAWRVPTQGLTSHDLYVTTIGGVFVGNADDLVAAPWKHRDRALTEEQLERLFADYLVERKQLSESGEEVPLGLWAGLAEGGITGVLAGFVPVLLVGLLISVRVAEVLIWVFAIGGAAWGVIQAAHGRWQ